MAALCLNPNTRDRRQINDLFTGGRERGGAQEIEAIAREKLVPALLFVYSEMKL